MHTKYPHISPYLYCAANPIMYIDPTGMDICVLLQPDGAMGAGHMAILIQNEDGSWSLWSKNGTDESAGIKGAPSDENSEKKNQKGVGPFKSIEEFFEHEENEHDTKPGTNKYTIGYLIQSTKEEDKAAIAGAEKELAKDYCVVGQNCAVMVQEALSAAGKDPGYISILSVVAYLSLPQPFSPITLQSNLAPNVIFQNIKFYNSGKTINP